MGEKAVYITKLGLERIEGEDLFTEYLSLIILIKILSFLFFFVPICES